MTLQQMVLNRLNAGTLLTVVIEPDEALAIEACRMAAEAVAPRQVQVVSILDTEFRDKLNSHRSDGKGVMIVSDLLRVMGQAPMARLLREFALQVKPEPPYPRIILIEQPGVEIPPGLKGDIEYVITEPPTREEIKQELEQFILDQGIKLEGNGEVKAAISDAVTGLARHEVARLFSRSWVELKKLDVEWLRKAKAERVKEQSGKALSFVDTGDVPVLGGSELMQSWLADTKLAFASQKARDYGLPEPKGILLVGVPGCGKSLTPKNIARGWGLPLLRLDMGAVFGSLVGQSEAQMRQALAGIEGCSPCVLWIDEIEKGLGGMKNGGGGDSGTSTRVLGTVLTWLQEKTKPIFVVATANSVQSLPPELLRKGRLDEIFFVDLPDLEERKAIAQIHISRKKREKILDAMAIATVCDGFSGAEIEQVLYDAMKKAFARGQEVTLEDIQLAVAETTPLSKTMAEDITKMRNWAKGKARMANKRAEAAVRQSDGSGTLKPFRATMIRQKPEDN